MTDWSQAMNGACRCARVRFRITAPPLLTMACHCVGCQKMTASAYSLSMAVSLQGFELIAGEPVIGGLHGPDAHHHHCDWCKSWLFTRIEGLGIVNVRPTMLDDPTWFVPFIETYASEKLPWATTPARHSFERFPEPDRFAPLIAEFSQQTW